MVASCESQPSRLYPEPEPLAKAPIEYVDPLIGTGGGGFAQGNAVPGATRPFGMVKVGPDTSGELGGAGFAHTAGYWHPDPFIEGFSHTHMHGTGVADYGNILFTASLGMDSSKTTEEGYRQRYRHEDETVRPGAYAVRFADTSIQAELTASKRGAVHRYTFPPADSPAIILDISHTLGEGLCKGLEISINDPEREISGWMINAGDFVGEDRPFRVYFSARFSAPFAGFGVWNDATQSDSQLSLTVEGDDVRAGAYVLFDLPNGGAVEARVGISYVDVDHARSNREVELDGKSFEAVREEAKSEWRDILERVEVAGGTESEREIFYTALYHSFLMPTLFSDADGSYVGLDHNVHRAEGFDYYTDFSLWDTYHTLHSLLILLSPGHQADMVQSLMRMLDQGGVFPRWPLATYETGTMIGSPADIVIAESYLKGLQDFDALRALGAMVNTATFPPSAGARGPGRGGISDCRRHGFCPADKMSGSVSKTLEYAYADFAIARLAGAMGRAEEQDRFADWSRAYRMHWDAETGFFRPRNSDGTWADPNRFDPAGILQDHYVEGNAWQYLWLAPYDVPGLIELFGSRDAMLAKLDEFFELSELNPPKTLQTDQAQYVFPDAYYWHGNEPDIHAAYMYTLAGRPDLAAPWIRWIMESKYTDGPEGLAGNDDAGTLSAWYVFSAMGIFPIAGSNVYLIGIPVFGRSRLSLAGGHFTIEARNASAENVYVRSATLNGKRLDVPWFRHSDLAPGGSLILEMGDQPHTWGHTDPLQF